MGRGAPVVSAPVPRGGDYGDHFDRGVDRPQNGSTGSGRCLRLPDFPDGGERTARPAAVPASAFLQDGDIYKCAGSSIHCGGVDLRDLISLAADDVRLVIRDGGGYPAGARAAAAIGGWGW